MQHGKVLNLRGYKNIFLFFKVNYWLIISALFFVVGLFIAVFTFGKYELVTNWSENYIDDFLNFRNDNGFLKILTDSFLSSTLFFVIIFICGASLFGIGLVPLCLSLRGFLYGSVTALLYSEYSLRGIAFHAVLIMPAAVFLVVALILASVEAMKFSLTFSRLTLSMSVPINLSENFRLYCYRFILMGILILLSALVDALISCNFLNNFSLQV